MHFMGKQSKVLKSIKVTKIKTDNDTEIIKQQSKLNLNGAHKSYTNYHRYTFKQNEVLMDNPI